jgi:hypothetical protein
MEQVLRGVKWLEMVPMVPRVLRVLTQKTPSLPPPSPSRIPLVHPSLPPPIRRSSATVELQSKKADFEQEMDNLIALITAEQLRNNLCNVILLINLLRVIQCTRSGEREEGRNEGAGQSKRTRKTD